MRELQKEGKIGRIEVDLERDNKITTGTIKVPTALDQSETTLIAAAIETIEKMGPCDAQIEVDKIEDVRGSKRDYIIERAKKLMADFGNKTDSREISKEIKESARTSGVEEYGPEKLPCGDISGKELIVVEGRADVLNLLRAGVKNVIAMNGTKLPESIRELSKEKDITLFLDGDRGGKLIAQNVIDNANVKYIAFAPDGKEVEELTGKEVLMNLRRKVPVDDFLLKNRDSRGRNSASHSYKSRREPEGSREDSKISDEKVKEKVKEIASKLNVKGKAIFLDSSLEEIKNVSAKSAVPTLRRMREKPYAIILDGTATGGMVKAAEEAGAKVLMAKNFTTTDTKLELMSF